jgi:hypothetical protein
MVIESNPSAENRSNSNPHSQLRIPCRK